MVSYVTSQGKEAISTTAGLVYGYCFQPTRNILAPWLAPALALIAFISTGTVVLVEAFG